MTVSATATRVVLIGPPGAGKGTQARLLEESMGLSHISSGDLLREAVRCDTDKGRRAKSYMERGELVPDSLVVSLIEDRLRAEGNGFLLDGFPRNVEQADTLASMLDGLGQKVQRVVSISVPVAELIRRLSGRRTCRGCGAMFHLVFTPPAREGRCDQCDGELYQRDDDREETIRARLGVFERETAPLLDYYRTRGLLHAVDGLGELDEVNRRIVGGLGVC